MPPSHQPGCGGWNPGLLRGGSSGWFPPYTSAGELVSVMDEEEEEEASTLPDLDDSQVIESSQPLRRPLPARTFSSRGAFSMNASAQYRRPRGPLDMPLKHQVQIA